MSDVDKSKQQLLDLRRKLERQERRDRRRQEQELLTPIQPGDSVQIASDIPGVTDIPVATRGKVLEKFPNGLLRVAVTDPTGKERKLLTQERFFKKVLPDKQR